MKTNAFLEVLIYSNGRLRF